MAVGESVEFAPRDPDPEESYEWRIKSAPVASQLELADESVVTFTPDAAGTYTLELEAPEGVYALTIRVFPGEYAPVERGLGGSGMSGMSGMSGISGVSGISGISGISGVSGSGSGARGEEESGGSGGRPRIQLHGRVEGDVVVVEADAQPNPNSSLKPEDLGVEFMLDDRYEVDTSQVEQTERELRVPLSAFDERFRVHAVALGESYSVADSVEAHVVDEDVEFAPDGGEEKFLGRDEDVGDDDLVTDGGTATAERVGSSQRDVQVERLYDPPEWSKNATLYEIYVRGYASDDEEADNTFEALEKRLPYLEDLGVDLLWLTPVLQNDHAPHGYNIVDFYSIADDLGTREDYESFVEAAHDRGMKVLFDLVMNHSARDHPYFQDAYKNPDSEYYDWYEWQDNGEPGTYFDWEYIANFNFKNLKVRRYLLDAVDMWADIADGFRCDMAWAVPQTFWQELRDRVKSRDPEFLLLDETIPYIADFHEGMFDMHFDTTLYFTLRQVGWEDAPAEAILDAVDQRKSVGFPDHASFMLYQENHDETRYIVDCGEDEAFASAGALFTLPGVPMLYGGQEIGQMGRRDPLAWEHANEQLQSHYERLIETRNQIPALGFDGAFRRVDYESDTDRAVAFAREHDEGRYVVALHFGEGTANVDVEPHVDSYDVVHDEHVNEGGELAVEDVVVVEIQE
jgi:glycosidase